jgi:hypothetical protein
MKDRAYRKKRNSAEISFRDLLLKVEGWIQYLSSKWVTIIVLCLLGAIIGYAVASIKKPVFVAATTFVLEDVDKLGSLGQYAGLASLVGLDIGMTDAGGIFEGDNIIELYKSNAMIEKTLLTEVDINGKKELLVDRYIKFNRLREKWATTPVLNNLSFSATRKDSADLRKTRLRDSVLASIVTTVQNNYLTIGKPDKRLNIIKAEVKAPDEFFAKNFDDQIVKNVNDYYIQTKTNRSSQNVLLLQRKTDSERAVMNGSIASSHDSKFATESNEAILGELVKNLELSKINLQKKTPLMQIIDRPKFPLESDNVRPGEAALIGFLSFGFLTILFLWLKKLYIELKTEVV